MNLITQRDLIREVAAKWGKQYPAGRENYRKNAQATYQQLLALDVETATAEQVATIIGNDSWTDLRCDECRTYATAVLQVGEEPDCESSTANLCMDCLQKAAAFLSVKAGTP